MTGGKPIEREGGKLEGEIAAAAGVVRTRLKRSEPKIGIILGSGLGGLTDLLQHAERISYREIPGFPSPRVPGHAGELVSGKLNGVPVLCQNGRLHRYEGHPIATIVLPVRVFVRLGIRTLIVTNAAGGIRRTLRPGELMLLGDQMNLSFQSVLAGPPGPGEERFPDMSAPYDPALRRLARETALRLGIPLHEGVYAGVLGPSYETPAEIRMLDRMGADAIGMSTVSEVVTARAAGLRCLAISLISNMASGIAATALSHEEVTTAARGATGALSDLLAEMVSAL